MVSMFLAIALNLPLIATPQNVPGIRTSLVLPDTTLAMGEPTAMELHLYTEPPSSGIARTLNRNNDAWNCTLVFRNHSTGAVFERFPYDVGMPRACIPSLFVELESGTPIVEDLRVYLLSSDGVQIPPGRYQLRAVYENVGECRGHGHPDGVGHPWTGTVESDAVPVAVTSAAPSAFELQIPTRIRFRSVDRDSTIVVASDNASLETVRLQLRPGYSRGYRYRTTLSIDSVHGDGGPHGEGGPGTIHFGSILPLDVSKRVFEGAHLDVSIDIEVFETSVLGRHDWLPERGDFRILWRGRVRGRYP